MLTPLTLLAAANLLQPSAVDAVRCAVDAAQAAPAPIERIEAIVDTIMGKCEPLLATALPEPSTAGLSPEAAEREKATNAALRESLAKRMRQVATQILERRS